MSNFREGVFDTPDSVGAASSGVRAEGHQLGIETPKGAPGHRRHRLEMRERHGTHRPFRACDGCPRPL
jgi:hypothetical protein